MTKHRVCTMSFASVYPRYVAKAERRGRTKAEVDEVVRWLTGYSHNAIEAHLEAGTDIETFLTGAPQPNPSRVLINGTMVANFAMPVCVFAPPSLSCASTQEAGIPPVITNRSEANAA